MRGESPTWSSMSEASHSGIRVPARRSAPQTARRSEASDAARARPREPRALGNLRTKSPTSAQPISADSDSAEDFGSRH